MQERLQKILSRAGVASRRKAEDLIVAGEITVNGVRITELGSKADPNTDAIVISGRKLDSRPPGLVYLAVYKPRGYVTTTDDPEGRATVMDLLGRMPERVYPVGRLDYHSEGLLLLTNDGDFANHLLSAKSSAPKKYVVKINGMLAGSALEKFRKGIHLDDGRTAPAKIRMAKAGPNPWYEVTLEEGRNRQIRRMFQALGFQVEKIKRIEIGALKLGKMKVGEVRPLTQREVHFLLHPEDAPPEQARRERAPRPVGPKRDDRPTVRRTAAERIESGEKIELRQHTEVEPPERAEKPGTRKAGRPAVRKSSSRPGVGPRPSRPEGSTGAAAKKIFGAKKVGAGRESFSTRGRPRGAGPRRDDRNERPAPRPRPLGASPRRDERDERPTVRSRPQGASPRRDDRGERPTARPRTQAPRPDREERDERPRTTGRGPLRPPLKKSAKRSGQPARDEKGQFRSGPPNRGFGGGAGKGGPPRSGGRPRGGPRGGR